MWAGVQDDSEGRFHLLPNGDLVIHYVTHEDSRSRFVCLTRHKLTDQEISSSFFTLPLPGTCTLHTFIEGLFGVQVQAPLPSSSFIILLCFRFPYIVLIFYLSFCVLPVPKQKYRSIPISCPLYTLLLGQIYGIFKTELYKHRKNVMMDVCSCLIWRLHFMLGTRGR